MSINRLPGLSGYDFTSIVQSMVDVYSLPKVKMLQQQSTLEVKQNAWRDVKTRLSSLEKTFETLRQADTWTATKASSSNESLLTVSSSPEAVKGVYNVKVISVAQAQTAVSTVQNVTEVTDPTAISAGSFTITVGGTAKTIDVAANASLKEISDSINNAKAGVTASLVKVADGYRLSVIANKTGVANQAAFAEVGAGTVLSELGILDVNGTLNESQIAKDAELEVNGITNIKSATNIVTDVLPGLTLTLKGESLGATISVNVEEDNAVAQSAVQAFVDQYNSVQSFIADKLSYDKVSKKAGDLFGDITLQNIQDRLRRIVTDNLNNPTAPYSYLSSIGITTSADNYGIDGTLVFDTAKFTEALGNNPESVANLFGAPAGGITPRTEETTEGDPQGLANILNEYLHPMIIYQGTLDKVNDNFANQITDLKDRITDFEDRIAAYEERLTLRFSSLEVTLAGLGAQSSWLSSQIGAMNAQLSAGNK